VLVPVFVEVVVPGFVVVLVSIVVPGSVEVVPEVVVVELSVESVPVDGVEVEFPVVGVVLVVFVSVV